MKAITEAALDGGWSLMYGDKHPFASGPGLHGAYLENADGFEVDLVADVE